jgi:hypothetical protein
MVNKTHNSTKNIKIALVVFPENDVTLSPFPTTTKLMYAWARQSSSLSAPTVIDLRVIPIF